jgi:hypothetical protein
VCNGDFAAQNASTPLLLIACLPPYLHARYPQFCSDVDSGIESTIIVAGDEKSGKSGLIQRFLDKGILAKVDVPTRSQYV